MSPPPPDSPPEWQAPRTDAGARKLIDELRTQFKALNLSVQEMNETQQAILKALGKVEVHIEVHNEREKHVVTWGRLIGLIGAAAVLIVSVCWKLTMDGVKRSEDAVAAIESKTSVKLANVEAEITATENRLLKHETEPSVRKVGGRR